MPARTLHLPFKAGDDAPDFEGIDQSQDRFMDGYFVSFTLDEKTIKRYNRFGRHVDRSRRPSLSMKTDRSDTTNMTPIIKTGQLLLKF